MHTPNFARTIGSGMISMVVAVSLISLAATTDAVRAQDFGNQRASSWQTVCENASTVMEMNWCSRLRYEAADSVLRAVYLRVLNTITDSGFGPDLEREWKEGLQEAQRLWEEARKADCGLVSAFEWRGGSGATGAEFECLATVTEQRAALLQSRYLDR